MADENDRSANSRLIIESNNNHITDGTHLNINR